MSLLNAVQLAGQLAFRGEHDGLEWVRKGFAPRPIYVAGVPRWRAADIDEWIGRGCPRLPPLTDAENDELSDAILREWDACGGPRMCV